jgi:sulfite dehydrogenase (quinone) subunit SoeC
MHPAFSVIFFTTASGAGYGLLALVGLMAPLGLVPADRGFGLVALGLAAVLISAGLLSSTAHLGRPERAWRALSQWKTSWLSREGLLALATYPPLAVFAIAWVFAGALIAWAAVLSAALALLVIWCTAMIYRSLKPIHQWCNAWVVPNYLAIGLMTGAAALHALVRLWGWPAMIPGLLAGVSAALALALKLRYWQFIDATRAVSTPESATGLGAGGRVRMLEAPHTEQNYLLKEMGYRIARKHAQKLRAIALALGFAMPLACALIALASGGTLAAAIATLAALSSIAGVLVERWLFFAEARHTVMLYYGASQA